MEEKKVLIKVENLSKKFCKDLKTSLWYGVKDLYTNILGNTNQLKLRPKEFWASKDINFELRRGECLGLIGHNGAGKSTLLKMLNGLINPDTGKIIIKGKVGALIELGAGFNPILTGRENIYNNGAVLGFSKEKINNKLASIIDFAELQEFIDMPVQNYSSGMKVRLGFAVAAQLEPDVLIIDEVLAVGDMGFALKCFKTIDVILPKTAVVFVSHSMPMVSRICNKIMLIDKGKIKYFGNDISKGIDIYYSKFMLNKSTLLFTDGTLELERVKLVDCVKNEKNIYQIKWLDNLKIFFEFKVLKPIKKMPFFHIVILDKEQRPVAYLDNNENYPLDLELDNDRLKFIINHKKLQLSKGIYTLDVVVNKEINTDVCMRVNNIISFQLSHGVDIFPPFLLESDYKIL